MRETKLIEHDPGEMPRRPMRWLWKPAFVVVALIWLNEWVNGYFDWGQIILGIGTGAFIMAWAVVTTDNRTPEWLKFTPSARRDRDL
jgi:hypothetical protein